MITNALFHQHLKSKNLIVTICFMLVLTFISEVDGQTFGNVPMGGLGFVSGIITNKKEQNLMYARTDVGGAYRWDAANGKWIPLLDWCSDNETGFMGVEALATDPTNPANLYMSVGTSYWNGGKTAILRSTDYGATFAITDVTSLFKGTGNGMGRNTGEKLVVDPNKPSILFCGSRANGLFKSINSGLTWSKVTSFFTTPTTPDGNGISFVVFDPSTGLSGQPTQTILVGVSNLNKTNLFRSDDGGTTFNTVPNATTTYMPERAVVASDRNVYITYANGCGPSPYTNITPSEPMNAGQIWKYNLSTGNFTNVTPAGTTYPYCGISVDPKDANRLVASTTNVYWPQSIPGNTNYGDQIFITTDGGLNWTNVVTRGFGFDANGITSGVPSIHWAGSIEFDPFNSKRVFITSGNGIFSTDNIDATTCVWKYQVKGLEESVPQDMVSVPGGYTFTSIMDYDGFRHNDVTKYGTRFSPTMGSTGSVAVASKKTNMVLRKAGKLYYSTDTGSTWTQSTGAVVSGGSAAFSADGAVMLYSANNIAYRSTDKGTTWTTIGNLAGTKITADPEDAAIFYAYSDGYMKKSNNNGVSFTNSVYLGTNGAKKISIVPGYRGHVWIAMNNEGLKYSTDTVVTFNSLSAVTYCAAVGIGKAAPGATYPTVYIYGTVGGVRGIFRSIDMGLSWVRINDDAHEWGGTGNANMIVGDMNVYGRVYMSTVGRGWVYIDSAPLIVSVTGVTVSSATATLTVGGTCQLTATVSPTNATNKTVTWSSSNPSVVSVNSTGLITGVSVGSSTVIASTIEGNKTANYVIMVSEASTLVENKKINRPLNIYPNPLNGSQLTVDLEGMNGTIKISIIDLNGRVVKEETLFNMQLAQLNINPLLAGTYIVRVINAQNTFEQKLVINK